MGAVTPNCDYKDGLCSSVPLDWQATATTDCYVSCTKCELMVGKPSVGGL